MERKKMFEDLYSKGKWIWLELEQMITWLNGIKTEMSDDTKFDTEFKVKKDVLIKRRSDASPSWACIAQNWKKVKGEKKWFTFWSHKSSY